jgi:hypothetical protein
MIITDGTRTTGVDWNSLPKALHVFCDKHQLDYVQEQLSKIYGSKATKFPMKTKMRFVKPMRSLCNQDSIMKYKALRHDQHIWCEHAHRRTVTGITDLERISGKQGDKMTLKERILSFQMEVRKKDGSTGHTQIFKAIDQNKRGAGYIFTFHPDAKEIAQEHIAGLYLFLQTGLTEEDLSKYFIPEEIRRGKSLRWRIEGKRVISADDLEIERISALDEDMRILEEDTPLSRSNEGDPPRLLRDKMDDETISTMNETANKRRRIDTDRGNRRGPPSKLALDEGNSSEGSSVSSMSSRTRRTTDTKISQLTAQLQDMKEMMNTIMAQQMRHQDEAQVCQTGDQESEIVEHQSPSRPFAGNKNAFTMSVTPAGYRTDTGKNNG